MQHNYSVRSTSRQTADIREPLVASLRENPDGSIVRRLIYGGCVDNPKNPNARLSIRIRHQRRARLSEDWVEPDHYGPAQLEAGQEIRLDMDTAETLALHQRLTEWYAVCSGGVAPGERILSVVDENDVTVLRGHEREILSRMVESGAGFWEMLDSIEPDVFTAAAVAKLHQKRVDAVREFERHADEDDWAESDWQAFFERETWIFGHGLAYQFLDLITGQPAYGGLGVQRTGLQLGDFLMATRATARFTVLVEIKRPDTPLLARPYRGDVSGASAEVAGGIAQVQSACRTWTLEGARAESNRDLAEEVETFQPRGILVVGNTSQLVSPAMRRNFELLRRNVVNPEILTFDELLARARFMVEQDAAEPTGRPDAPRASRGRRGR